MSKLGRQLSELETIIRAPHVTERSSDLSANADHPVFTFVVAQTATKAAVARAIRKLYNLKPTRVNLIRVPAKKIVVRGKIGRKAGYKKALVFLKKGDKIDFV